MKRFVVVAALAAVGVVSSVNAETLASGSATIDFDQTAWAGVAGGALTLSTFFNQAEAENLTVAQLLSLSGGSSSYLGQGYNMNGATVADPDPANRTPQPTTFAFTPGQLTLHTGVIGLGGVARFAVYGGLGGSLLFGDYSLQYDASRIGAGASGWYLTGNITFPLAAFDILTNANFSATDSPSSVAIAGDLGVAPELAGFLGTPGDALKDVGNFSFAGVAVVPEPSSMALVGSGVLMLWAGRKRLRAT
jgi:hypothetical protein